MTLTSRTRTESGPQLPEVDPDALIKEARRLRRRRWLLCSVLAALAATVSYLAFISPPNRLHSGLFRAGAGDRSSAALPTQPVKRTRSPDLILPTTLASIGNGDLLILDSSRDQILELDPRGRLSVFAGDGRLGFAGDGGQARDAELDLSDFSSPGMVVTSYGNVDVLDTGNCEIRTINRTGIIRTLLRRPLIKLRPSGSVCSLTGLALSPSGTVYVSTEATVDRLSSNGQLIRVAGKRSAPTDPLPLTAGDVSLSPTFLQFSSNGALVIANDAPNEIERLTPAGKLISLGAIQATALTADLNGAVLIGTASGVIDIATTTAFRRLYAVNPRQIAGLSWGHIGGFEENGMAVTPRGAIYVDNAQGNGYGAGSVLVKISTSRHAALVPIHTALAATLPQINATGFPGRLYPTSVKARGHAVEACPSSNGLLPFTPAATAQARRIARSYLSSQFAADIAVTDRSWWAEDFRAFATGGDLGEHTVRSEKPASQSPAATKLQQACGRSIVAHTIAISVAKSPYSTFTGTIYLLDRDSHPMVYDVQPVEVSR